MILALSEDDGFRYTEAEARLLTKWAATRAKADAGDRRAKAQIATLNKTVRALSVQARRNPKAARLLRVYRDSGLLAPSQTFAME